MECSFFFEILAHDGLEGIEQEIRDSELGLYVYRSGFNNKCILKNTLGSVIGLDMDTSTTEIMTGSGSIEADFETAKGMMLKLSKILKSAGFNHKIGVDDENGENTVWYSHNYS
jgi:hypothetical protein